MPNLLILSSGPDTGGCGIGLKRAFDRHAPEWSARAVCRSVVYLDYPTDIVWPAIGGNRMLREVALLVRRADVIHVMDNEAVLGKFRHMLRNKVVVVHHLGTHYRRHQRHVRINCRSFGAIQVTDSVDLIGPDVEYLPVTTDLQALADLRNGHRQGRRIRIAHAPTHRPTKSTEAIIRAIDSLSARHPIDFDLIERVSNAECLQRKAKADIFVDQLRLGFGVNAIECWAMGIPVVSGLEGDQPRANAMAMWGGFPWADATEETLEAVIEHLILNRQWRQALVKRSREHVWRWHSEKAVVEQTLALYQRAGVRVAA